MRVLQINANYGYGSTGIIMRDIGETLLCAGHEAFFAYQRSKNSVNNGYVIGNVVDWKCHAFLCRIFGGQGFYSRSATKKLCDYLDEIVPDVVHLHNLHSNFVHLGMLLEYLAKRDIPTVITMHDCWYFTGKCFHFIDVQCERYKIGCGNCPKQKSAPKSCFFDYSKRDLMSKNERLHAIPRLILVGCSKWISLRAKESLLKDIRIKQIYNGVDIDIFKPMNVTELKKQYNIGNQYVVLGMANKWCNSKNIKLIKTVSELPNTVLMLIGCKNQDVLWLKECCSNVVSVGYISDRHMLAMHYSMADVFVNLTLADTLPTVNMESICCGTPVITYDSCGSPELINDDSGIVVPKGDHEKIIESINIARNKKWEKCRQSGILRFDKQYCYQRYLDIYKLLCKEQ